MRMNINLTNVKRQVITPVGGRELYSMPADWKPKPTDFNDSPMPKNNKPESRTLPKG
jgi:hypothetical protein